MKRTGRGNNFKGGDANSNECIVRSGCFLACEFYENA